MLALEQPIARPLGRMEKLYWQADRACSNSVVGIGEVGGSIPQDRIKPALAALQSRHPLLRVKICREGWRGVFFQPTSEALQLRELTAPRESVADEVDRELHTPFAPDGPLGRCVLLRHDERSSTVLFTFSHAIGDGTSGAFLLRDLLQAIGDQTLAPLKPRPSLEQCLPREAFGLAGLRRLFALIRSLASKGPPKMIPLENTRPASERRTRLIARRLDPAFLELLTAKTRSERCTIHGALSAALLLAVAEEIGGDRPNIACGSPITLRDRITPPAGDDLGFLISVVGYVGAVDRNTPFWDLAREVRSTIVTAIERGDHLAITLLSRIQSWLADWISLGGGGTARLANFLEKSGTPTLALSNIGAPKIESQIGDLTLQSFGFCAGLSVTAYFASFASTVGGRLAWNFAYCDPLIAKERAERIADRSVELLNAAVQRTPS